MKMVGKKHLILFFAVIAVFSFAFQYMCGALAGEQREDPIAQFLVNLPACCMVGVIDFWIVRMTYRFRRNDNTYFVIAINLFLAALCAALLAYWLNIIVSWIYSTTYEYIFGVSSLPLALWNCIVVLLIEIFFYYKRQIESERRIAMIEKEKIQYQYETLKAQVNPHFLFNSLNVLSSLAYEDSAKANLFAKKLSNIYRYVLLTNTRPTVPISEELSFLNSFIYLEKIRFGEALHFEVINDSDSNGQIIPVSLQLLVENATKHNIASSEHPLKIRIHITNENIIVSNNLQLRHSVEKGGYGLSNLRKQYGLYGEKIVIKQNPETFTVILPYIVV